MAYKQGTVSITDLQSFSECRRQWYLGNLYEAPRPAPHFWLGSTVHAGLESYYKNGCSFEAGLAGLHEYATKSLAELERRFPHTWDEFSFEFDQLYAKAVAMFQNYCAFDWESPIEGQVYRTEQYVKVPFAEIDGRVISISGRIDLIMGRDDQFWVVDHKTAKQRESNYGGLDVDEQLTGYAWLAWKITGIVPTAVMYNVLIKELPDSPRILKDGSVSKDVSQSTVHDLYLQTLVDLGITELGPYEKILTVLRNQGWSRFFFREGSTRNINELHAFEKRAQAKIRDIAMIMDDPSTNAYPSPSTSRCGWCPFLSVCKAMDDGSDYQAILDSSFLPRD